jgi:F-type H+-transporting ATPase subunit b
MLDFTVTSIITILNIIILFLILRKLLFKPVTKFMADRTEKIQNTIEQAEKDKTQAKALLEQYEDQLKKAEGEAQDIIRAARDAARQESEQILAEGKAQAEALVANARKQLETDQRAAFARFKAQAAALVVAAAGQLLKRELKEDDSRRQAVVLLEELGKD